MNAFVTYSWPAEPGKDIGMFTTSSKLSYV